MTVYQNNQTQPYYTGDFKVSLNFYSLNSNLNSWRRNRSRPTPVTTMEAIEYAKKSGYEAVDVTMYYIPGYENKAMPNPLDLPDIEKYVTAVREKCADLGLYISGTGVYNNFASPDPEIRALDIKRIKYWLEMDARMGAPVMRVFAGPVPEGYENRWEEMADWMTPCLRECAEYGKQVGVKIGLQNHGDSIATAEQTIKLLKMVDSDNLGIINDTGYYRAPNSKTGDGYDWYKDIAAVIPYTTNFQIKRKPGGVEHPEFIDLHRLCRDIRSSSYRGYLPIEVLWEKNSSDNPKNFSTPPYEEIQQFHMQLREALEQTRNPA